MASADSSAAGNRAIAAAIRAHGACGHLRARVASIQMRLRDRKRELARDLFEIALGAPANALLIREPLLQIEGL